MLKLMFDTSKMPKIQKGAECPRRAVSDQYSAEQPEGHSVAKRVLCIEEGSGQRGGRRIAKGVSK